MSAALILTDGKAGHENQSKAFVRSIGLEPVLMNVRFRSKTAKALSYIADAANVHTMRLFDALPEDIETLKRRQYGIVAGAGSGTFYAVKTLAGKLGVPCAAILYPRGYRLSGFDCILAPEFDNPASLPNVVKLPVNISASDDGFYNEGVKSFRERHADSGRKAVAVIIGGPNKCASLDPDWLRSGIEKIFRENGRDISNPTSDPSAPEIWVTTSRRTPPEADAVVDSFPFDYKLVYSRDHFNPVPAFVALASRLYVTAESTGMLSEACSRGTADVRVLDNLKPDAGKFRRFADWCAAQGSAKTDLTPQFAAAKRLLGIG